MDGGASFFILTQSIMNTLKVRAVFTKSHAQLRALRREHIDAHRHAILTSTSNTVIHQVALDMINLGLYAKPPRLPSSDKSFRDFRFSIARAMWQIDKQIWGKDKVGNWWFWLPRNGFGPNFNRNPQQIKTA